MSNIGIYAGGLYTGAEGYIVAKFVSPFDSHPFLWIVLLAAVPVVSFAALWPLFKFKQKGIML